MMKIFVSAMFCFSLLTVPAFAEATHDLTEIPRDLLEQGLRASVVCGVIDGYGIKRMLEFYKNDKDDSTTTNSPASKAALSAGALYDDFLMERMVASGIAKVFTEKYGMTSAGIMKLFHDEAEATQQSLQDKFDKIDTYNDLAPLFQETLDSCSQSLESFTNRVKSVIEDLDAKPTDH